MIGPCASPTAANVAAIGATMAGVAALLATCDRIQVVRQGRSTIVAGRDEVGVSFDGIDAAGERIATFADIEPWDRDSGEACVCFSEGGRDVVIAPATAPDPAAVLAEVEGFLRNDWFEEDDVFLSDIDGPTGDRSERTLGVRREGDDGTGGYPLRADDELVVLGTAVRLGDVAWFGRDADGDGNRHAHLVTTDGRYLRASLGDLGR